MKIKGLDISQPFGDYLIFVFFYVLPIIVELSCYNNSRLMYLLSVSGCRYHLIIVLPFSQDGKKDMCFFE